MNENLLRKHVLGGKKTERLVFAVTPEMKEAVETIAKDKCITVSAMLTQLAIEQVMANKELFSEEADW